jgi:hypothetical protein
VTFSNTVTMTTGSAFNGGTGTTTFSVAPTLTAGTFTVGSSGSTGKVTMTAGASFTSGMTLAFPNDGGELATASAQTISVAGIIQSAVTGSTKPRIDCPTCTGTQGFTMTFTNTATLNVDGLQFDRVSTAGVQIADMPAAKWIKFQNVKFTNNAAQATTSGTHLAITRSSSTTRVPGCYFDATAQYNVTASGTSTAGVLFIFEDQGSSVNGPRAGEAFDLDADTGAIQDNIADSTASPRFGSVVEWAGASPSDTAGAAVGFPTAAFDWNTFSYYGIYAAYKNVDGSNNDTLWKRNSDGSAAYSITFADSTYSDLIGTPNWDTVNETTVPNSSGGFGLDINGDGDATDTNVHVVYLATTGNAGSSILPRVIKLIDTGSALVRPSAGAWSSDFSSATVKTITSPVIVDATNIYFGGTDSSNATKIFGVQITAASSNEKTLQKNTSAFGAVTATPAWKTYSGNTFLFLGTAAVSGQAYVYRMNVTSGSPADASFTGSTTSINDSVRLINNRAVAVTEGGKVYVLDASNFNSGGFTNLSTFNSGSPYSSASGSPMRAAPYVDYNGNYIYVCDNSGRVYVITSTGANLNSNYPFLLSPTIQLTASPLYLKSSGVIAVGGSDGAVYFINRQNASGVPSLYKKFFVTASGSGSVSTIAYNNSTAQYMVSSTDGKLVFIKASDVPDPDTTE